MKTISATAAFCGLALIISTSCAFGKVVFTKDKAVGTESELPPNPSKTELKTLSEEVLEELRSLDSSDTSARSFGFLKHKLAAIESKLAYLFSKVWSPFAPVYIDVAQDPYSSSAVYYRKDEPTSERPSIFSHFFKSPPSYNYNDYYNYNNGHSISKRSISSPVESQGRTLEHILPAFQNRLGYLMDTMNRVFGHVYPPQQPPTHFQHHSANFYKTKLENPLEYQNNFSDGTSSQFHFQSAPSIPNFLKRLGIISSSDGNGFSDYLTRVLRRVQTPVVKQKHAESAH